MSNVVDINSVPRQRRDNRAAVPENGAMILLFTGLQYVRNEQDVEMYQALARKTLAEAQHCRRQRKPSPRRKTAVAH